MAKGYQRDPQIHDVMEQTSSQVFFNPHPYLPGGSNGKESACNAGDAGLIPGPWRSPKVGNGISLQYSCLENPMDRERSLMDYSPWGHSQSDTTEQLTHTHISTKKQKQSAQQEKTMIWNHKPSKKRFSLSLQELDRLGTQVFEPNTQPGPFPVSKSRQHRVPYKMGCF